MARAKKSRKIGQIGVRKSPDFKRVEKEKRIKKVLGKPAGNRNNQPISGDDSKNIKTNKDPRLGSKKPIELFIQTIAVEQTKPKVKTLTFQQELSEIENDDKLSLLIGKLDSGLEIDRVSQNYIDQKLNRHKLLCEILGIKEDIEEDVSNDDDDLYAKFEKINVNKLKDY
ncbi:Der GTPase-activating protein YihI [Paraglaciecola sp.]|uniref:Der GTPase-activating protein YihI n=1 Tax=Paraglaciecola sp. TaxID=1920173 RepID=UPI0030F43006